MYLQQTEIFNSRMKIIKVTILNHPRKRYWCLIRTLLTATKPCILRKNTFPRGSIVISDTSGCKVFFPKAN